MSKQRKPDDFIKKPIYQGGIKAMRQFISENLKYPKAALENKTEGTVLVKYDIDYTGKVTDGKVIRGLGDGCDEEALRVVKLLKFEVPKGPRKLRVLFHKEIKIYFKLPRKKVTEKQQVTTQYKIVAAKKKDKTKAPKKTSSFSYTIKW